MAARDFDATATPRDVVAALGLKTRTRYFVQNVAAAGTLYMRRQTGQPAATARALCMEPSGYGHFEVDTGEGLWVWTDEPDVAVIIDDAP